MRSASAPKPAPSYEPAALHSLQAFNQWTQGLSFELVFPEPWNGLGRRPAVASKRQPPGQSVEMVDSPYTRIR
jgi:hypothetical protein